MLIIFYIFTFNLIHLISNQKIVPLYWHTLHISGIEWSDFAVLKFLERAVIFVCVCFGYSVFLLSNSPHVLISQGLTYLIKNGKIISGHSIFGTCCGSGQYLHSGSNTSERTSPSKWKPCGTHRPCCFPSWTVHAPNKFVRVLLFLSR